MSFAVVAPQFGKAAIRFIWLSIVLIDRPQDLHLSKKPISPLDIFIIDVKILFFCLAQYLTIRTLSWVLDQEPCRLSFTLMGLIKLHKGDDRARFVRI